MFLRGAITPKIEFLFNHNQSVHLNSFSFSSVSAVDLFSSSTVFLCALSELDNDADNSEQETEQYLKSLRARNTSKPNMTPQIALAKAN